MKFYKLIIVLLLIFTSCKSAKNATSSTRFSGKNLSAKKVSSKHIKALFDKQTIDAKLKVVYQNNKKKKGLSVKLRIDKDKMVWLNATYYGVIVARAKITPTKVQYYEKLNKTYFEGDFSVLENVLGTEVNFQQLQNMLLGQAIFDLKKQKYKAVINNNAHLLLPVKQKALYDILFWINPNHFKLDQQELKNLEKNQTLNIGYKEYKIIEGEMFPKHIVIRAKDKNRFTNIDIEFKTVVFNKRLKTPFKVPRGYKQVVF